MIPIIVDVETAPHPLAADYVEPPDVTAIKHDARLKDPEKIAVDLLQRTAKAREEYTDALIKAALDWNLCRIVSIAWTLDGAATIQGDICRNEAQERDVLAAFWHDVETRIEQEGWFRLMLMGFCARTFDVPVLLQRSRLLELSPPPLSLARFEKGHVLDLWDKLTFDDTRGTFIMPRTLTNFCRRFGIPVDDVIAGPDIPGLVDREEWDKVWAHNVSDVRLTAALAKRLGLLAAPKRAEVF